MRFNKHLLTQYARVMVLYALNGGTGIKKGETVWLCGQQCTEPLFKAIAREIWKAGGNVILRFLPNWIDRYGINRPLLEVGTEEQLSHFPMDYWGGVVNASDHLVFILSQPNVHALEGIDSTRIALMERAKKPFMDVRKEKERQGKLDWTLCLWPTPSAAKEAGLTLEEYTEQIINACYLTEKDPIAKWRDIQSHINVIKQKLNTLQIEKVHIVGDNVNLHIQLGENRKFIGATGHNIPSFEVYISPDCRGTEGYVKFNQPLYHNSKRISGIQLWFEKGLVVRAMASENEDELNAMIAQPNANKIGEFSLTPGGFSPINTFMAHTLYDENRGGEFGNFHVALGNAYTESYTGDETRPTPEEWEAMGFNKSVIHTDIISTESRTVTAVLKDGARTVIYEDGQFMI